MKFPFQTTWKLVGAPFRDEPGQSSEGNASDGRHDTPWIVSALPSRVVDGHLLNLGFELQ
jgi:hypothetical protein